MRHRGIGRRWVRITAVTAAVGVMLASGSTMASAAAPVEHQPQGHFDSIRVDKNLVYVSAWSGDADRASYAASRFVVRISNLGGVERDTTLTYLLTANRDRPDVQRRYPGLGLRTGFYDYFILPPGEHTICFDAEAEGGTNRPLGCRTVVTTPPKRVFGHIDAFTQDPQDPTRWIVRGWVLDRARPTASSVNFELAVQGTRLAYDDNTRYYDVEKGETTRNRADVLRRYPGYTTRSGFEISFRSRWGSNTWNSGDVICIAEDLYRYLEFTRSCKVFPGGPQA